MQAREYKSYVNYKKPNKVLFVNSKNDDFHFLIKEIRKGVNRSQQSEMHKKRHQMLSLSVLTMTLTPIQAKAEELTSTPIEELPNPTEVMEFIKVLMEYSIIVGVGIGAIWLVITRLYYYLPKR